LHLLNVPEIGFKALWPSKLPYSFQQLAKHSYLLVIPNFEFKAFGLSSHQSSIRILQYAEKGYSMIFFMLYCDSAGSDSNSAAEESEII